MTKIVLSPFRVASSPNAGGHFWVYMQYAAAFAAVGCDVYWLEKCWPTGNKSEDREAIQKFFALLNDYGFADRVVLYEEDDHREIMNFVNMDSSRATSILAGADLFVNFHYEITPKILDRFSRTALVDIDPGLLQFWMANSQMIVPPHDLYFTTGETVGKENSLIPNCSLDWIYSPPAVFLDLWPFCYSEACERFTTVSSWWGEEYIWDGKDLLFENNKRVSFLEFIELPTLTGQELELALSFGNDELEETSRLESFGWKVLNSKKAAGDPVRYQSYIQGSRGEFSCVKPSCLYFQNAWISDRTLCYLASGKPAIVQGTGPSMYLPDGEGLVRFGSLAEIIEAIDRVNADYKNQCCAARDIAESHFSGTKVVERLLNISLPAGA